MNVNPYSVPGLLESDNESEVNERYSETRTVPGPVCERIEKICKRTLRLGDKNSGDRIQLCGKKGRFDLGEEYAVSFGDHSEVEVCFRAYYGDDPYVLLQVVHDNPPDGQPIQVERTSRSLDGSYTFYAPSIGDPEQDALYELEIKRSDS